MGDSSEDSLNIYIIGAGLSGLSAAKTLEKAGYSPIILESENEPGGRVRTTDLEGYQMEHGFQVMLDAYPKLKETLDYKALDLQTIYPGAVVFKNGKRYKIGDPTRALSFLIPSLLFPLASISDKFKTLKLNLELKKKSIETIFQEPETTTLQFLQDYGFSSKIINNFFKPFFAGIFLEPELKTSSRMF